MGFTAVMDMDFHWHLALGGLALRDGVWPSAEPFSHLPIPAAPDHQAWLADTLMAAIHRYFGVSGVRVAAAGVVALGAAAAFRLGERRGRARPFGFAVAAMWLALADDRFRLRPDLVTLAFVPLIANILDEAPGKRRDARVFGLTVLWTNLHPGAVFAPLFALGRIVGPEPWLSARTAAVALLALAVHPDGPASLLVYAADTAPLRPLIPEWQRLTDFAIVSFPAAWSALVLILPASAVLIRRLLLRRDLLGWHRSRPGDAAVAFAMTYVGVRFTFTLALAATTLIGSLDDGLRKRWRRPMLVLGVVALSIPIIHLAGEFDAIRQLGATRLFDDASAGRGFPTDTAAWISRLNVPLRLGHPPAWGGYLAHALHPSCKTATDGRVTRFGPELARRWAEIAPPASLEARCEADHVDMIVMPAGALPINPSAFGWLPLYSGNDGSIAVLRAKSPQVNAVKDALRR